MRIINRKSRAKLASLLAFVAISSGCATVHSDNQSTPAVQVAGVQQQPEQHQNAEVVWGGTVIGIENRADETWIEVIDRPLSRNGVPNLRQQSTGRFLAVVPGFLDPLDYSNGRSITITGTIDGNETRKIDQADYNYPVVSVVDHELWSTAAALSASSRYTYRAGYPYYGYYRYPHRIRTSIFFGSGFRFGSRGFGFGRYGYGRSRGGHRGGSFISGRTRY